MASNVLSTLVVAITADTKGLAVGMATGTKSVLTLGTTLQTAGVVALGAFAAASVDAALDFDRSFARIASISNVSEGAIEGMKDEVMALAGETAIAPKELADALFFLASAGLDANQVMPALEASAKAAAVGLGEAADVANIVASALNAYPNSALTAAKATDILVAAVREGRAEPEEFANALGRILPIASQAGVTFDQVAASIATLSNIGLDVNEGVTAMRGVLQAIVAPGNMAAEAMAKIGLNAQMLLDAIAEDGVLGALRLLDEAAKRNTDSQADYINTLRQVVPNVRALTGVLGLSQQEMDKVDGIARRVKDSTGDLGEAFQTTAESDAFRLKQALNDLAIAGQKLASDLLPILVKIAQVAAEIGNVITMPFQPDDPGRGGDPKLVQRAIDYRQAVQELAEAQMAGNLTQAEFAQWQQNIADSMNVNIKFVRQETGEYLAFAEANDTAAAASARDADANQRLAAGLDTSGGAADAAAQAHRRNTQAMEEEQRASLALAGGMLGIIAQADQLQDSQAEVNRLQERGKRGTEAYRDASLKLLQDTESLKQGLADYGDELVGAGQNGKAVIRTIFALGKEMGLTKGDVRDLLGDVEGLTGSLQELNRQHPKPRIDLRDNATPKVVSLEDRLNQLAAHDWEIRIHATEVSHSPLPSVLIRRLMKALEDLTGEDWEIAIHAMDTGAADQLKGYLRDMKELERTVGKLNDRIKDFQDNIRSGFSELRDLVGGMNSLLDQFAADMADFLERQAEGTLEPGEVMPTAPDLHQFLADQVAQAQEFADVLKDLQEAGLSQANLAQLAAGGPGNIDVARALLGDPALIDELNAATKALGDITETTVDKLTKGAFGDKVAKLADDFDRLRGRLEKFLENFDVKSIKDKTKELVEAFEKLTRAVTNAPHFGGGSRPGDNTPEIPSDVKPPQAPPNVIKLFIDGREIAATVDEGLGERSRIQGRLSHSH